MITEKIHRQVEAIDPGLPGATSSRFALAGSAGVRSGPQYNMVRAAMENSGQDFPPEIWTLGAGYDVFGHFAYAGSTKMPLFDWDRAKIITRRKYKLPNIVSAAEVPAVSENLVYGESALELQTNFSNSVSSGMELPGLFSATVQTEINTSTLRKSRHVYSIFQKIMPVMKFIFDYKSAAARELLNEEFKEALSTYDPFELFNIYGTHFLSEIILGGRIHYSSSTKTDVFKSDIDFASTVKGSCALDIGTFSGKVSTHLQQKIDSFNQNSDTKLVAYGGDPALIQDLGSGGSYKEWSESVKTKPGLVDFGNKKVPFIPIWELAADPERQMELKRATDAYLIDLDGKKRLYTDRLVDVVVITGGSGNIAAPAGYEKIGVDLNWAAGGDYIYLCPAFRSAQEIASNPKLRPIIELGVAVGKNARALAGWKRINVDLNKGAGGKFIWLCVKYGTKEQISSAVSDIAVVWGSSGNVPPPFGYTKIPIDLNWDAGGKYIYLCYTRDE